MAVILRIVLPLLVKALNEFDYIEGVLQEFAKQSAEQIDEFSLRHTVVLLCITVRMYFPICILFSTFKLKKYKSV